MEAPRQAEKLGKTKRWTGDDFECDVIDSWHLTPPSCLPPQFRLKRCGLGHRVYLVEEYGSAGHLSLPESTLLQAVTNTQVSPEGQARLAGTP